MSSKLLTKEERERILKTLEVDMEFRYAVAGLIGLDEILKRLDRHEEQLVKILERLDRHEEELKKIWERLGRHEEELRKIWERLDRHEEQLVKIWERLGRHEEELKKIWERLAKIDEEIAKLRKDFLKMVERMDRIETRLTRVERTLEKLTLDIEDEARSIIRYRLRSELGVDMEVTSLQLPDLELNIYGVVGDVCVIGEASVRAGVNALKELLDKVEFLKRRYSEKLRPKTILIIYASLAMPELVEEARKYGVWVLKASGDYHKPDLTKANPHNYAESPPHTL